jgi:hypothetical protein
VKENKEAEKVDVQNASRNFRLNSHTNKWKLFSGETRKNLRFVRLGKSLWWRFVLLGVKEATCRMSWELTEKF